MKKTQLLLIVLLAIASIGVLAEGGGLEGLLTLAAFATGIYFIYKGTIGKRGKTNMKLFKGKTDQGLPSLSRQMEDHYATAGMTKQQIILFRETMNTTKDQIVRLQDNVSKNAKLKAIDLRHDTVRASKGLFKELVKDPKKLPHANHFLYTHLPNIVDLSDKYIEINGHEIKTKETYAKLEESAKIIDQMADLIASDYKQFVADDIEDLAVELTIAKNSLKQEEPKQLVEDLAQEPSLAQRSLKHANLEKVHESIK